MGKPRCNGNEQAQIALAIEGMDHFGTVYHKQFDGEKLTKKDFYTGDKFFIEGSGLLGTKKRYSKNIVELLDDLDLDNCLAVTGAYGMTQFQNNFVMQYSESHGLVKLPGGKAPGKEIVEAMTDLLHEESTQKVLKSLGWTHRSQSLNVQEIPSDTLNELIGIAGLKKFTKITTLFPLWLNAVTACTTQDAIMRLQEMMFHRPHGAHLLRYLFDSVEVDKSESVDLQKHIMEYDDEYPKSTVRRETREETSLTPIVQRPIGSTIEVKFTSKYKKPYLKYRYLYNTRTDGDLSSLGPTAETDEEKKQRIKIFLKGALDALHDAVLYTQIKTGNIPNHQPIKGMEQYPIIEQEHISTKLLSQISNNMLLIAGVLDAIKSGKISPEEYRRNGEFSQRLYRLYGLEKYSPTT